MLSVYACNLFKSRWVINIFNLVESKSDSVVYYSFCFVVILGDKISTAKEIYIFLNSYDSRLINLLLKSLTKLFKFNLLSDDSKFLNIMHEC